jgi:uncharacterized protein YndB with AHSA1/START domain
MNMPSKKNVAAPEQAEERELIVSRVIDAPRERVWRAFADPEEVLKWWGPNGFTNRTQERSFKPGGEWRHVMIGPDGTEYPNLAHYEEIVELERIVYTNGGGKKGAPGVRMRTTISFKDLGGKTEVSIRHVFDTREMRDDAVNVYGALEGGRQALARLNALVTGVFTLFRLVDAPRERVWKAWTEPARLEKWFGPKGAETKTLSAKMELKPGGVYHYGMSMGGKEMWGKWTFREVTPPSRLVWVNCFSDAKGGVARHPMSPNWPLELLTTVTFQDFGPKTLIALFWEPLGANTEELKTFKDATAGMCQGWGGTFEQLDAYLKENK